MSFKGLSFALQVTRDSDGHSMTVPLPVALVGLVAEAIDKALPGDHPELAGFKEAADGQGYSKSFGGGPPLDEKGPLGAEGVPGSV